MYDYGTYKDDNSDSHLDTPIVKALDMTNF